ncbi:copper resistance protein NlpE [Zhouia spongiae]|uniref:Copper resistance protein NlpE n=1 Tax=Zhouia spongiae TaxID=2202721 RepID=A0ABY3YKP0_9FLAO|nr:copper resistance protein NlpE [Zhouia spongiae]UNY98170.1 copper resistance protein NlpE [Zhouia spongiae]
MKKFVLSLLICYGAFTGCKNKPQHSEEVDQKVVGDIHNAQNSLDWEGAYTGILPCADCEGIQIKLIISSDNSYSLEQEYLGKEADTFKDHGTFSWDDNGTIITLNNIKDRASKYFVGENKLIQLDLQGNKITGELSDRYILTKE